MPSLPLLLAQEVAHAADKVESGFNWQFLLNPAVIWVFIPLTAIIVGAIGTITNRSQQHRERMAMIAAGLHPDFPPGEEPEAPGDDALRETAAYRSV